MTDRIRAEEDLLELALARLEFDPSAVEFRSDGSAVLHADPDILVPPIKLGQYRQLLPIDDRYFPAATPNGEPARGKGKAKAAEALEVEWDHFARWLVEVLAVFGIDRDVDSLPGWALDPRLKTRLLRHWRTVPFVRPDRSGTPTT